MMRRFIRRPAVLLPWVLATLVGVPLSASSDEGTADAKGNKTEAQEMAEMAAAAKVTIQEAIKAATQKVRGKVIEAELEEKPRATWEVEVLTDDGKIMEIWVDVDTGAVVAAEEKKPEEEDKQEPPAQPQHPQMGRSMGGMMPGCCGPSQGGR